MSGRPLSIPMSWDSLLQTIVMLLVGLLPPGSQGTRIYSLWESSRLPEQNRADREKRGGGYYEGLIGVDAPGEVSAHPSLRFGEKWTNEPRFTDANISRRLPGDFLMFELLPNVERTFRGHPFTTNVHGMRDRPCTLERTPKTMRIVVLGSSIDMGWGVGTEDTYVNRLEDWLNDQASKRGISCKFEVLNFAVAAYSPLQRLESFRRKAAAFRPDLVLYSATTLDIRLLEIHLCDMLQYHVDLTYPFLREEIDAAGINEHDLRLDSHHRLRDKTALKAKLRSHYWTIYDRSVDKLAQECQALGVPLAAMIIPRSGEGNSPKTRAPMVAQLRGLLERHANVVLDLSDSFDGLDPSEVEISVSDDHPNALGHKRLTRSLANALVTDPHLHSLVFAKDRPDRQKTQKEANQRR